MLRGARGERLRQRGHERCDLGQTSRREATHQLGLLRSNARRILRKRLAGLLIRASWAVIRQCRVETVDQALIAKGLT